MTTLPTPGVQAESFIPLDQVERAVVQTLRHGEWVDDMGVVQPLTVNRSLYDPERYPVGPVIGSTLRDDIFFPQEDQREYITHEDGEDVMNRIQCFDPGSALYAALTDRELIMLSEEEARVVSSDQWDFSRRYGVTVSRDQLTQAFHIKGSLHSATPEFADTRLYIPGKINGLGIARRLIQNGARFAHAKVWSPEASTTKQLFRADTPIVTVRTQEQLESTIHALREVYATDPALRSSEQKNLMGQTVEGLPGVYMGQTAVGTSFNGTMKRLWKDPLQHAFADAPLFPGDILDWSVVGSISAQARNEALEMAPSVGVDPGNHAFLIGEDIVSIMAIANAR